MDQLQTNIGASVCLLSAPTLTQTPDSEPKSEPRLRHDVVPQGHCATPRLLLAVSCMLDGREAPAYNIGMSAQFVPTLEQNQTMTLTLTLILPLTLIYLQP